VETVNNPAARIKDMPSAFFSMLVVVIQQCFKKRTPLKSARVPFSPNLNLLYKESLSKKAEVISDSLRDALITDAFEFPDALFTVTSEILSPILCVSGEG